MRDYLKAHPESSFDSELVENLARALQDVWRTGRVRAVLGPDAGTWNGRIAARLVEKAKQGERGQGQLYQHAIAYLRENKPAALTLR